MRDETYQSDATTYDAWSQVYTGPDWVAQWMSDRGYTDAEIAYVVDRPTTSARAVLPVVADVPPVVDVEDTDAPVWTVRLDGTGPDATSGEDASVGEHAPDHEDAQDGPGEPEDAERGDQVPA